MMCHPLAMRKTRLALGPSCLNIRCSLLGCTFFVFLMGKAPAQSAQPQPLPVSGAERPSLANASGKAASALGSHATARSEVRADLSLPKITTQLPPDLQIQAGSAKLAEALAHYSTALQLEKLGQMREALTHFLAVLELDPANPDLAAHTSELVYHYQGRKEAIAMLNKAVAQRPDEPAPYLNLVRFLTTYAAEDAFEADRAQEVLIDALKRFPARAEVYTFASLSYLSRNMRAEALAVMDQALKQSVTAATFWTQVGRAAQQVWPLAQTENQAEHRKRVNAFFDKALTLAPTGKKGEPLRLEVAQYYLLSNQLDRAKTLCEQLSTETGNLQARKILYRLYEAAEERDKSLAVLEKIVQDAPTDVEQRRLLVSAYLTREMPDKAVPHLEAVIQLAGGESSDYQELGDLMLKSQLYDRVIQLSERSVKLYPDVPIFHVHAALAHRALLHWEKAIQSFEQAHVMVENSQSELVNHRFYFQYGLTLERAGRADAAGKMFEKAITLTPKDEIEDAANTMNYLGFMWLDQEKYLDKAGELIRKANELQPNNAAYIDSLGWWHFKKGDYPNALKELERAFSLIKELEPEDAEIIEHIAQTYLKMNELDKARASFEQARALQPTDPKLLKRLEDGLRQTAKP
jgi:tetratricopeptide (TPR) repeat protein